MLFRSTKKLIEKQYLEVAKDIFSIPNLSAIVSIYFIFLFYFKGNTAGQALGLYTPLRDFDIMRIFILALFCLLEFGLYMIAIYDNHKRDVLFWIIGISLAFIPLFKVGFGRDFCMRASVPALFALMILVIRYATQLEAKSKINFARAVMFIIILTLGVINPVMRVASKIAEVKLAGGWPVVADNIITFSDKDFSNSSEDVYLANVMISSPETTAFYKYLAKPR